MQRVFVVGCPRSGTTLVQAMLARHPDVFSLPETLFFEALLGDAAARWGDRDARSTCKWHHRMGIARSRGRRCLRQLERLVAPGRRSPVPWRWRACVRRYVGMLDRAARQQGCACWVEKTPIHLLYLDEIEACVPDVKVVHVLRRGIDVVASIIDADLHWNTAAFYGGVAQWSRRWNHAMDLHARWLGRPRHHALCLEDVVADPRGEWERLRRFLALDPAKPLACWPRSSLADVRTEPWKAAAIGGTARRIESKARTLFGPRALEWLDGTLADYGPIRARVAALAQARQRERLQAAVDETRGDEAEAAADPKARRPTRAPRQP